MKARGFSLLSGGLDSQLAVCVLREAGAEPVALVFESPFFSADAARRAAGALGVALEIVDFTERIRFDGNEYFLMSNSVELNPRSLKQTIKMTRWY